MDEAGLHYADAVVQTVRLSLMVLDSSLRVHSANAAFCSTFQMRTDEVVGRTIDELGTGQWDIPRLRELLGSVLSDKQELDDFEVYDEFPGIGRRFISLNARPLSPEGKPDLALLAVEDITDRRRTEQALRRESERLKLAIRASDIGIWELQLPSRTFPKGHVVFTDVWEQLGYGHSGQPPGFAAGIGLAHPDDRKLQEEAFRAHLAGETPHLEFELRLRHNDGSYRTMLVRGVAAQGGSGRPTHIFGSRIDITERKRGEEKLAQLQRERDELLSRLRLQFERMPIACLISDPQTRIIDWNPAAEQVFGYRREEVLGIEGLLLLVPPASRPAVEDVRRRLASGHMAANGVHENVTKDGRTIICEWYNTPLRNSDGEVSALMAMALDITERQRAEVALRASREQLRRFATSLEQQVADRTSLAERRAEQLRALAAELTRAEQLERRRISAILHDHLQQLLLGAQMHFGIVCENLPPSQHRQTFERGLEILREATESCRTLAVELSPPVLHDRGLVAALDWLARRMRDQHRLTVELSSDSQAEPAGLEARELLFQIARELLLNVVKHARTDRAWVGLSARGDQLVELEVRDEGAGFDAAAREAAGAPPESWGLFRVRERLESIGGTLSIHSAPGEGTRVRVLAPMDHCPLPPPLESPLPPAPAEPPRNSDRIRVLLVDDHQTVRESLAVLLDRQRGIEVIGEVAEGRTAVEIARDLQPNVVIMDINLPDISGIDATRQIVAAYPRIRVIGLSLHEPADVAPAMLAAGAVAYLPKQAPSAELIQAIRAAARS